MGVGGRSGVSWQGQHYLKNHTHTFATLACGASICALAFGHEIVTGGFTPLHTLELQAGDKVRVGFVASQKED